MVVLRQLVEANIERIIGLSEGLPSSATIFIILFDRLGDKALEALDLLEKHNIKGTEISRLYRESDHDSVKFMKALRSK